MIKKIFGFHTFIFGSVWFFLFVAGRSKLFRDPGSFAHTIIGEHILNTGHLIYQDIFSFTCFGKPWIAQQWLGECMMAVIQRMAGFDGLLVVTVSLIALLYFNLALRIERSGMNLVLGSFILAFSLAASSHHFHVRPHIATIFLMTMIYAHLCDIESGKKSITSLVWLIPVFIIWSNIHGGALGGLFTIFIVAVGWTLASLKEFKKPLDDKKSLIILWCIVVLCFVSPLVNPYGVRLPVTWLRIMGSGAISQFIQEHASVVTLLHYGEPASYVTITILLCFGSLYLSLLVGVNRNDRKVTWYIPMIWFFLSLSRIRHVPLFALMAVVAIVEMFPYCNWVHSLEKKGLTTFKLRNTESGINARSVLCYLIPVFITVSALVAFHESAKLPAAAQKWVKLDNTHWPVEILPELQAIEKIYPQGTPIFNDMLFGGFLMYHTPGLRVFIDDRFELYGDEFIIKYIKANKSDFETWEKIYHFHLALLSSNSDYRKYLEDNPEWHVVKRCRAAILYQKI
jgi:hypothetical protein